jgi:hypothetical protein
MCILRGRTPRPIPITARYTSNPVTHKMWWIVSVLDKLLGDPGTHSYGWGMKHDWHLMCQSADAMNSHSGCPTSASSGPHPPLCVGHEHSAQHQQAGRPSPFCVGHEACSALLSAAVPLGRAFQNSSASPCEPQAAVTEAAAVIPLLVCSFEGKLSRTTYVCQTGSYKHAQGRGLPSP